jgi:hypothetical protein
MQQKASLGTASSSVRYDAPGLLLTAIIGALLSLALSGFVFGINNNEFHLPIVGLLYDEPQFAHDEFIQSLRYFSSGLWLLLRGADRYVDPHLLFLGLDYISRFIAFLGFLVCADLLGIRTSKDRAIFTGFLCLTILMRRFSYAGAGGLFINYFTHSEFANGLTLFTLYFAIRGRLAIAFLFNGAVFFINAFFAVWNAIPLGLIIVFLLFTRRISIPKMLIEGAVGLLLFAALSYPVVSNIMANPEFGVTPDFDIVVFHAQYNPSHFLFAYTPFNQKLAMFFVIILSMASFATLGRTARPFLLAMSGYVVVYVIGIAASYFTHNMTVLDLHLLRVSTMFHLLAALGSATLIVRWLASEEYVFKKVLAPVQIALLCSEKHLLLLSPFPIILSHFPIFMSRLSSWSAKRRWRFDLAALIVVVVADAVWIGGTVAENIREAKSVSEWEALGHWARQKTRSEAVFLIPAFGNDVPAPSREAEEASDTLSGSMVFEYASYRQIWVVDKQGGATMLKPSFYKTWRRRESEVEALRSLDEKLTYARANAIDYVIEPCGSIEDETIVFKTDHLCVYRSR